MDFWSVNWGDVATTFGVVVSLIGLGWAIKEARGARSASEAAQSASRETRDQIARHLQTVDLERAIGLIQRVKLLHDTDRWEAATDQYQALRAMLNDIVRWPTPGNELRDKIATARMVVRDMENTVGERGVQHIDEGDRARLNRSLNNIQSDLEELASSMGIADAAWEDQ